ncbi:thiamine diphosphokinase [Chachezhania antarctica]|uniref:thiamine diphosphokinase n=1 Tax=Chachezhania antarctica TaxID=2340860 RepID=UPI001F09B0DF|nr:thiamine diphosphokinase [Chachezhania antarctica]
MDNSKTSDPAAPIVDVSSPVTLIGGGLVTEADLLLALERAPVLVAADGGAIPALAAGHVPQAVIGDFDSLPPGALARIPADRQFRIAEQDSTDFDKALRSISAPLILAVGFLGARLDHQLAALNVLVRHSDRPCLMLGPSEVVFHLPPVFEIALSPGDPVSLFPMRPVAGRSTGLEWPIDGLHFAPGDRVGTSNRALGPLRIDMAGPGMLVMLPRSAFDAAITALVRSPAVGSR